MNVGERLVELRNRCWLTQNGLAERAGVSQTHLRRVELGQADITVGHLQLLCDAMDISLQDFFNVKTERDELSVALSKLSPKQKKLLIAFIESLSDN
ncbi:MAG: helix-turn-helix transcriptional regulator [Ruminococcaceae bacterium]|nr:helix-turn-helix transcriptional regulator [Oscillospiraceae bacterium]